MLLNMERIAAGSSLPAALLLVPVSVGALDCLDSRAYRFPPYDGSFLYGVENQDAEYLMQSHVLRDGKKVLSEDAWFATERLYA